MKRLRLGSRGWPVLFVAPAAAFFFVVSICPMLYALFVSLHDWNPLAASQRFVLFDNYLELLSDGRFHQSLINTFLYAVIIVPCSLVVSLLLATLLDSGIRAVSLFRTLYFLPVVTSLVATGYIWKWLYDPVFGPINDASIVLGIQLPFLKSTTMALPSIALMSVWKNLGFNVVILLAGLQVIPRYVYEAARVDGASRWRTFWRITVPLLNPSIVFLSVMGTMNALKIFGEVFVMAEDGGPLGSTASVVFEVVRTSFRSNRVGYGAAMTIVLFLIIIGVTLVQMRLLRKRFHYG